MSIRIRIPAAEELAAAPHLAALAALEAALAAAARAIRAALPAVDRGPFPGDSAEITTARILDVDRIPVATTSTPRSLPE